MIEDDYHCPYCAKDLADLFTETYGPETCPACGGEIEAKSDEWYDRETGNDGWHYWLEKNEEPEDYLQYEGYDPPEYDSDEGI